MPDEMGSRPGDSRSWANVFSGKRTAAAAVSTTSQTASAARCFEVSLRGNAVIIRANGKSVSALLRFRKGVRNLAETAKTAQII
jgi:hypothetical protein